MFRASLVTEQVPRQLELHTETLFQNPMPLPKKNQKEILQRENIKYLNFSFTY